jgi:tight adherence protein B
VVNLPSGGATTAALSCLTVAALLVTGPGSAARLRFATLWPVRRTRRRPRPLAAGPVLAAALGGAALAGPGGGAAAALVVFGAVRRRHRERVRADATATAAELADAVSRIADELRSGSHPAAALAGVVADGPRARTVLSGAAVAARLGDAVPAALRRAAADRPAVAAEVERIATAWSLAERHGVPLADLLAQAHRDIRWRVRFGAAVRAQLAGPRATAHVLTALPLLGLGLGELIGADPIGVLRSGLLGQVLLVVGVGLAAAGAAWSDHILRRAVP